MTGPPFLPEWFLKKLSPFSNQIKKETPAYTEIPNAFGIKLLFTIISRIRSQLIIKAIPLLITKRPND
ncbi:hypothetical protein AMS62_19540 [Bacillus sp. FJAT-18019]|nr:hypothetical protein AMS62_19540 [Bacillus sp. FJAT-18019]